MKRFNLLILQILTFVSFSQTRTTSGDAIRKEITPKYVNGVIKQFTIAQLKTQPISNGDSTTLYYVTDTGRKGYFELDKNDNSSTGNDSTIIVTNNGRRLKRTVEQYLPPSTTGKYYRGDKTWQVIAKSDIPTLSNVDNTSDLNKPISTATQTALLGKLDKGYSISELRGLSNSVLAATQMFYCSETGKEGFWKYDASDNSSLDNIGSIIVTNNGKRLKRIINENVLLSWFGEQNIKTASDFATSQGKDLLINYQSISLSQSVYLIEGAKIKGFGVDQTVINYSGYGALFVADKSQQSTNNIFNPYVFEGFTIKAIGTAKTDTTSKGIKLGNTYGSIIKDIFIRDFEGGVGLHFCNNSKWTEGTVLDNVNLRYNKIGWLFSVEGKSLEDGYFSFCNTRAYHVNIVTKTNQIGVKFSPNSNVYASTIVVKGNFETDGTLIQNQIGVLLDNAKIDDNNFDILFEGGTYNNANECIAVKLQNNSLLSGYGLIRHQGGFVNSIVDRTSYIKLNQHSNNTFIGNFPVAKRVKIYTFKEELDDTNNNKLFLEVRGGTWFSNSSAITSYSIANRGGLKIYEHTKNGKREGFNIKAYKNIDNTIDIVFETTIQFTSINVDAFLLENFTMSQLNFTSQNSYENYDISGKIDVTPLSIRDDSPQFNVLSANPEAPDSGVKLFFNSNGLNWINTSGTINTSASLSANNIFSSYQRFNSKLGLGIGSVSDRNLAVHSSMSGSSNFYNIYSTSQITSSVQHGRYFSSYANTEASSFTTDITHYFANQGPFGAGSTINNQFGFYVSNSLIGGAINIGFRGSIPSGTNRWNLYMDGTANNYIQGDLQLGSLAGSGEKLQVSGDSYFTGKLKIQTGANKSVGTLVLTSGLGTITSTAITTNSIIWITTKTLSGTSAHDYTYNISADGTATITARQSNGSTETGCNSTIQYWIIN